MIALAISILWLLIGIIILGGVIYLALLVLKLWFAVDPKIEQGIWLIFFILVLIYALMTISGNAPAIGLFHGR